MRSLSLIDVIIIGAVLALLYYVSAQDFPRYAQRTFDAAPAAQENG